MSRRDDQRLRDREALLKRCREFATETPCMVPKGTGDWDLMQGDYGPCGCRRCVHLRALGELFARWGIA